jgi:tetratricopeptide (TPR) repeat protein
VTDEASQPETPNPAPPQTWRDVWQLPLLGLAAVLLIGAVAAAFLTAPKPDLSLGISDAQRLMAQSQYEKALSVLNDKVLPGIGEGLLTPDQRRQFHILRAQCLYLGQRNLNLDRPENNRAIVSEYLEAEHLNAELSDQDAVYLSSALISLGEVDRAVRRIQNLPDSVREVRTDLVKRAIDICISQQPPNHTLALDLLTFLSADPRLTTEERAWALARQGQVLLDQGYTAEAISKIVRALPRLDGASPQTLGEIHYILARAYDQRNEVEDAIREVERALARLDEGSRLIPSLTLLQGEIFHRRPSLGSARDRYLSIISKYSFSDELPAALLGMGEVEAESLHSHDQAAAEVGEGADTGGAIARSLDYYTRLVDLLRSGTKAAHITPERVGDSLLTRFREQFEGKKPDYRRALQFAALGEQLFGIDKTPPDLILALAQANHRLAEEILTAAAGSGGALSLANADPATQREARDHLIRAGEYYRTHASRVVAADSGQYGDSLWAAADVFDRAGDTDAAVSAFQQFAADFPTDPRQPEAGFRLAQCFQSRGDLDLAANIYRELIAGRDRGERAGPFADASYVPLAQTLLADADPANDAQAEELLLSVVNGALGGTRTPAFRDALRELGQRYYSNGRYERAIERFEEYLARAEQDTGTASDAVADGVRYKLADAYRLSAAELAAQLVAGAMPEGERREREKARDQRLVTAGTLFEDVRRSLEGRRHRTTLEDLYLRNSYYYLGACAFDLKDFQAAIAHYDAARERYPKDPASLVAMAQVVSCYLAQGDLPKAALANQRAQRFYESLPASAWEDPNLPMTREDWKHWLNATEELRRATQGRAGVGPE